jgi:hypothetical protein
MKVQKTGDGRPQEKNALGRFESLFKDLARKLNSDGYGSPINI